MQCFLGVDVSKAKLDVALMLPSDKFRSKVFANDALGFKSLLQWLQANATGGLKRFMFAWKPRVCTTRGWPASCTTKASWCRWSTRC